MKLFCYYSTSAEMETMFKRNWNTSNFENANVKTFSMIPFAVKNKHEKMRKVMQDKCIEEIETKMYLLKIFLQISDPSKFSTVHWKLAKISGLL